MKINRMKYIVTKRVEFDYHVEADSEEDALEKFKLEEPTHWDINIDVVLQGESE